MFSKVYVIDDDEVTLYLSELVLSFFSTEIRYASFERAAKALSQLQEDKLLQKLPDLILMDLNMPVMDGYELLEALQHLFADLSQPPLVYVLSSTISESDRRACQQCNMVTDLLEKPLTTEYLDEISAHVASVSAFRRTQNSDVL